MHGELTIQQLRELKSSSDPVKITGLIQTYASCNIKRPTVIKFYHDLLLYYRAFPFDSKMYQAANDELQRLVKSVKNIYLNGNPINLRSLMGTGIAHTELFCNYSSSIAGWLVRKFPASVELGGSDASEDTVSKVIQSLLPAIEFEKVSQGQYGLGQRIKFITGLHKPANQLSWLLRLFEESKLPPLVKEALYEQLKIFIRCSIVDENLSRSFNCLPVNKLFFQKDLISKVSSEEIVKHSLAKAIPLSKSQRIFLIDSMKASLASIYRETDPVTYADEKETELFDVGRGVQVALTGMRKDKRLALESYIGYMAFKNGVPVSYGGGWMWGQRCKIGVNIYPAFRKGESAWLFCQILRIYYQHFGVRHFLVKPYQFGKGNPEGLNSGAFWFYYKLGFRPVNPVIKAIANEEWNQIQSSKGHRTSIKVLRHFTSCNLEWMLSQNVCPTFDAGLISAKISKMIDHDFGGNRHQAVISSLQKMENNFPLNLLKIHNENDRVVMENWALLIGLLVDIEFWDSKAKIAFIQLVNLKMAGKERDFVIQLQKHKRLWISLQKAIELI